MTKRPNIILLVLDGLRADRLHCYGYSRETSPNLDALAGESRVFLNHYTASFCSMPSHISMLTGVHPQFHKAASNYSFFDGKMPYLPELLREAGYFTFGISSANPYFTRESGFIRGFDEYVQVEKGNRAIQAMAKSFFGKTVTWQKLSEKIARRWNAGTFHRKILDFYSKNDFCGQTVVSRLSGALKQFPEDKPFFVFANILETHGPHLPPGRFRTFFGDDPISDKLLNLFYQPYLYRDQRGAVKLDESELRAFNNLYDGSVRYADYLVGQFLDVLRRSGRLDDSVLIVTSDHGMMMDEKDHLIFHDGTYQEIIRVPLIVRAPGGGVLRTEKLTSVIDVFSTALAAGGVSLGRSFSYRCQNLLQEKFGHPCVISEIPEIPFPARLKDYPRMLADYMHTNRTIVTDRYKLIWRSNGKHLIFDLKIDPNERNNLFPSIGRDVFERLIGQMTDWYRSQLPLDEVFCLERFQYNLHDLHESAPALAPHKGARPKVTIIPDEGVSRQTLQALASE